MSLIFREVEHLYVVTFDTSVGQLVKLRPIVNRLQRLTTAAQDTILAHTTESKGLFLGHHCGSMSACRSSAKGS
jgi:hypothetical protein